MKYDNNRPICQNCKHHKNKPSRCMRPDLSRGSWPPGIPAYVSRKQEACAAFTPKSTI